MKRILKTIALTPMWPLIWLKLGFNLKRDCFGDKCVTCRAGNNCCTRAHAMVNWWRE